MATIKIKKLTIMNEKIGGIGRTVWIVAGIAVFIGAIFGLVWFAGQMPPSLNFVVPHTSCSFAKTDASGNYSVTIIAGKNYNATAQAVVALITKHHGELLAENSNMQPYQNDAAGTSFTNISSMSVSGNIPIQETAAFMDDVVALAPSSSSLQNVNYSKTAGAQLNQTCTDDQSSMNSSEALIKLYVHEMPTYLKAPATDSSTSANYYPPSGNSNLDDLNNEIQTSYNNISSDNDGIAQLYQNLNMMGVSITVQDKPQPVYPPTYSPPSVVPTSTP